ncbi:MAG: SCO1664 family protein [Micromonosporaceae bacterium]
MTRAPAEPLDESAALTLLRHGELELEGLLAEASNATLRAVISHDGVTARCIYKPVRGERPLWDFPDGTLAGRELAAYLVSVAGGWDVVPPTVLRDGPLGPGACQLWLDEAHQPDAEPVAELVAAEAVPEGWLPIAEFEAGDGRSYVLAHADDPRLARLAVFDAVVNNADRKGGHLLAVAGRVYGVDHGVCFHVEPKLRTVLWGWAGDALDEAVAEAPLRLAARLQTGDLSERLAVHLTTAEVEALSARVRDLAERGRYPAPRGSRPLPWPPI